MKRGLPEITRTHDADAQRHAELLGLARAGHADAAALKELTSLDADLHRFNRMCRQWMPLSPTEIGFTWGEALRNEIHSDVTVVVRECALVSFEGEDVTLLEVCRRLASRGLRVSLGGWIGSAGVLADLAGLRPSPTAGHDDAGGDKDSSGTGGDTPEPAHGVKEEPRTETVKKTPTVGGNYDLFG